MEFYRNTPNIPEAWLGKGPSPPSNVSADVHACLRKLNTNSGVGKKEGLAIVISLSPEREGSVELQHAANNMKQYADKHGYHFYIQYAQTSKLYHFFSARWFKLAASQMWQKHEWVLHLDADSIFVDFDKSFESFTSSPQDLIFQIRLNKEVTAAVVLMRTSPFAGCFLHSWASKGRNERQNYDNGDLLLTLLEFAAPDLADKCDHLRDSDYAAFVDCFGKAHARLLLLDDFMPIRVSPPLTGFQKSLEGLDDPAFQAKDPDRFKLLMRCWSTDLVGHGSKSIGTWAWSARKDKNGTVPNCLYNTAEEELYLARRCCLYHFPGMQEPSLIIWDSTHCMTAFPRSILRVSKVWKIVLANIEDSHSCKLSLAVQAYFILIP